MLKVRTGLWAGLLAAVCLAVGGPSFAGKGKEGDTPKKEMAKFTGQNKGVQALHTAFGLIELGRDKKNPSPEALLMAAKIIHEVSPVPHKDLKVESEGGPKEPKEVKAKGLDPKALVAEAMKMPGAKEPYVMALAKHVNEILAQESKGSNNPMNTNGVLFPKQSKFYYHSFRGGEVASVALWSENGADLDLFIYTANGQLVTQQTSSQPNAYLNFNVPPGAPMTYKIKAFNYSPNQPGEFVLITN